MEKFTLPYGDTEITYYLIRKNVKNINMKVKADGNIYVSANASVPKEFIVNFIRTKSRWIAKALIYFEKLKEHAACEKHFVEGDYFYYQGRQYRLVIVEDKREYLTICEDTIILHIKDSNNLSRKKSIISKWYKKQTKDNLTQIFRETCDKYKSMFDCNYIIKIRSMKTRWGSCMYNISKIHLNSKLIYAPKHCVEYVVLHELCHFKIHNHSKKYYELLFSLMPDWKARKKILDEEITFYCRNDIC